MDEKQKVDIIMVLDYLEDMLGAMAKIKCTITQDDRDWLDELRKKWEQ